MVVRLIIKLDHWKLHSVVSITRPGPAMGLRFISGAAMVPNRSEVQLFWHVKAGLLYRGGLLTFCRLPLEFSKL
jgi:hypothetical protein